MRKNQVSFAGTVFIPLPPLPPPLTSAPPSLPLHVTILRNNITTSFPMTTRSLPEFARVSEGLSARGCLVLQLLLSFLSSLPLLSSLSLPLSSSLPLPCHYHRSDHYHCHHYHCLFSVRAKMKLFIIYFYKHLEKRTAAFHQIIFLWITMPLFIHIY